MALVDADPYGLDILSVYNYGSKALKHENERLAAGGKVVWIGVLATEFSRSAHAHSLDEICECFLDLASIKISCCRFHDETRKRQFNSIFSA